MDLVFRKAKDKDLELMMAWRSHPEVYRGFYIQNRPLTWKEHLNWWKARRNRMDWIIGVVGHGRTRWVGSVNASRLDTRTPEVGIYVGEVTLWGIGIGRRSIVWVASCLKKKGYKRVRAAILEDNVGSQRAFENVGFRKVDSAREGEWLYEIEL